MIQERFSHGIYRDCQWCQGKGCLCCPAEADKEYRRQFPDGPKPIAVFNADDPADAAKCHSYLAGLAAAMTRTCHDCRYCGPNRPEKTAMLPAGVLIRCDHESWVHWDEEMRVFAPDFAPECDSFEPKPPTT